MLDYNKNNDWKKFYSVNKDHYHTIYHIEKSS